MTQEAPKSLPRVWIYDNALHGNATVNAYKEVRDSQMTTEYCSIEELRESEKRCEALRVALNNIVNNPVATGMSAGIRDYARRHNTGGDDPILEGRQALSNDENGRR